MRRTIHKLAIALAVLMVSMPLAAVAASSEGPPLTLSFATALRPDVAAELHRVESGALRPDVRRVRYAQVDVPAVLSTFTAALRDRRDVEIELFGDRRVLVRPDALEQRDARALRTRPGDDVRWHSVFGHTVAADGGSAGHAVFTLIDRAGTADDAVMASIVAAGSLHAEVSAVAPGVHGIYELDADAPVDHQLDDRDGISHASTSSTDAEPAVGPSSSTTATTQMVPTVAVLVVFTSASKTRYGNISNIAASDIDRANDANYAGGITSRFALAGVREVVYSETQIDQDLTRLAGGTNGLEPVERWREQTGGDLVSLYGIYHSAGPCGEGYMASGNNTVYGNLAFSVVDPRCASIYTAAHEWGHNLGLNHDRGHASGQPAYPYAYGWLSIAGDFRTVMAYDSASCPGGSCSKTLQWSNPRASVNGLPAGAADADNVQAVGNLAPTAADFRGAPGGSFASGPYWYDWPIARGIDRASAGGYLLDGWGGVHALAGAPTPTGAPYWTGQDLARGIDSYRSPLGSEAGVTIDRHGGLHRWGGSPSMIGITGAPYWPTSDLARGAGLVGVTGGSAAGGVTLDAFGGIHAWGGVSVVKTNAPYWPGWDVARDIEVLPGGAGGYTLDQYGGIHAWGAARPIALTGRPYWSDDRARAITLDADGTAGYLVDRYGGIYRFRVT